MIDNFSIVVSYEDVQSQNFSLNAGQYFDVKTKFTKNYS